MKLKWLFLFLSFNLYANQRLVMVYQLDNYQLAFVYPYSGPSFLPFFIDRTEGHFVLITEDEQIIPLLGYDLTTFVASHNLDTPRSHYFYLRDSLGGLIWLLIIFTVVFSVVKFTSYQKRQKKIKQNQLKIYPGYLKRRNKRSFFRRR
ncbi:MAG: hypothetical protein FWE37_05295 [Spirochaetaceae bacterium]|nr:hypothetical protein [Spirochaetaceae bacterium]